MSYHALHHRRWRIAIALTAVVAAVYFGFILLVAYAKPLMGRLLMPGLRVGILLGIVVSLLTRDDRASAGFDEMVSAMTSGSRAH